MLKTKQTTRLKVLRKAPIASASCSNTTASGGRASRLVYIHDGIVIIEEISNDWRRRRKFGCVLLIYVEFSF